MPSRDWDTELEFTADELSDMGAELLREPPGDMEQEPPAPPSEPPATAAKPAKRRRLAALRIPGDPVPRAPSVDAPVSPTDSVVERAFDESAVRAEPAAERADEPIAIDDADVILDQADEAGVVSAPAEDEGVVPVALPGTSTAPMVTPPALGSHAVSGVIEVPTSDAEEGRARAERAFPRVDTVPEALASELGTVPEERREEWVEGPVPEKREELAVGPVPQGCEAAGGPEPQEPEEPEITLLVDDGAEELPAAEIEEVPATGVADEAVAAAEPLPRLAVVLSAALPETAAPSAVAETPVAVEPAAAPSESATAPAAESEEVSGADLEEISDGAAEPAAAEAESEELSGADLEEISDGAAEPAAAEVESEELSGADLEEISDGAAESVSAEEAEGAAADEGAKELPPAISVELMAAAMAPARPAEEEGEELSGADFEVIEEPAATPPAVPPPTPAPSEAARTPPPTPQEMRRRRRKRPWFEEIFDENYLRTLPHLTPQQTRREAAFIEAALSTNGGSSSLLDVGCGYGRHAMELAARGHQVTGLDMSLALLIRAADEAQRRGFRINFVHGDMRELSFEEPFDGAYCMCTTFGYFDDDANRKVAQGLARALKPGGRLLLDVVNRDYVIADLPSRVWWEGDGCVVLEEVDFNAFSSRLLLRRSVAFEDGRQLEQDISIRVYSLHELGRILQYAGLRVVEVTGNIAAPGRFFGAASRNLVVLAERRPLGAAE